MSRKKRIKRQHKTPVELLQLKTGRNEMTCQIALDMEDGNFDRALTYLKSLRKQIKRLSIRQ